MQYTPDNDAKEKKRDELLALARRELGPLSSHAPFVVDNFTSLVAPQNPPIVLEMIVANRGGRSGGRSRKPGNILLNWRRLFGESPDLILTGAGVIATPWLIPLAALSIFNKLWANASIELTKEQATCLFAMWHRCDDHHVIDHATAGASCRELFSVYLWPEPSDQLLCHIYQDLQTLRCIEPRGPNTFWLREGASNTY